MPKLKNVKHEAVLQAYLLDKTRVGWRAYKAVYPKSSQRAAEVAWSRLLTNAEFTARRDELLAGVLEAVKNTATMDLAEVLEELSKLGRSNIQNMVVDGDDTADVVMSLRDMTPAHAATISELTIETYVEGKGEDARDVKRVRLKLHDKKGALSELRRHFEPDRHEHSGPKGAPIAVADLSLTEAARRIAFALVRAQRAAKTAPKPDAKKPRAKKVA